MFVAHLRTMLTRAGDLLKDVRFGLRMLRRAPVFTAVAVLSLALGIGGSAAVFALINAIVLRPLPVPEPSQLFVAERASASGTSPRFSWPSFERTRDRLAGRAAAFAESHVYQRAPGIVVRCADCDHVLARLTQTPTDVWLDLRGAQSWRIPAR